METWFQACAKSAVEIDLWNTPLFVEEKGNLTSKFTAVIQQDGDWWIGWIEEVPGVNSQGKTREELLENLQSALQEALAMDGIEASEITSPLPLC